jgi:hypothetical protein
MEHFVTLFDSLFLPQGLALHTSMERHAGKYTLWILCMDQKAHDVLTKLNLPNVRLLRLCNLETPELLAVKPGRTKAEYCWTLTPFTYRFVFESDPGVTRVTYLDADLWFRSNPQLILREFEASGKDVLITDHAYAAEHDQSTKVGIFCVQFMTFLRGSGETVRKWWEEKCIEWCFNKFEDGRFGDQKYLDDWPTRFEDSVHVLTNKELLLAPWNASRFPHGYAVAWHFHGFRIVRNTGPAYSVVTSAPTYATVIDSGQSLYGEFGQYVLPELTRQDIYRLYVDDLRAAIAKLTRIGFGVKPQKPPETFSFTGHLKMRLRRKTLKFLRLPN